MAPLVALLIIPFMGMLAFSVDIGYVLVVKSDLQNAADAAALAGAQKLQDLYVQYNLPNQTNKLQILLTATTNDGTSSCPTYTAEKFAKYNKAGGVYLNVPDSDVEIGFTDAGGNYSALLGTNFPNTITVTTRRQGSSGSTTNGGVGLFFAPVFGLRTKDLSATARATIYAGDVSSFKVISGIDSHVLPVALDYNAWVTFYQTGQSPDGNIYSGPNGAPQLQVYPSPGSAPGNFGLIDVGPPQNNAPAFRQWIDDGETPNDIQYLLDNNLLPVSLSASKQWKAGPGLKSTLLSDFQDQQGKANLIPLFKPVSTSPYQAAGGSGSNTYYTIVGFVGVQITTATSSGSNMNISIQPTAAIDATSVISNAQPAGTQTSTFGTTMTTFISAKLTR